MARDPDTIQREIEQARDALASTLDQLGTQASPKRMMDNARASALTTLDNPKIKYPMIGLGVVILLLILRRLVR